MAVAGVGPLLEAEAAAAAAAPAEAEVSPFEERLSRS